MEDHNDNDLVHQRQVLCDERTPLTVQPTPLDALHFEQDSRRRGDLGGRTTPPASNTTNGMSERARTRYLFRDYRSQTEQLVEVKQNVTCRLSLVASISAFILCIVAALLFSFFGNGWTKPHSHFVIDPDHLFDNVGRYVVEDYDSHSPFTDFLPGLAGIYGKPLYAFLVNRGQAIATFGFKSKDYPIMEFESANKAYQSTPTLGFRTFIKGQRRDSQFLIEPFSPLTTNHAGVKEETSILGGAQQLPKRFMYMGENEIQIRELDRENHLETNVTYFILPEEDFGAFVRRTTITNTHPRDPVQISLLDGLAQMQPAGGPLNNYLKTMGNTLEAWMGVEFPYSDSISMPFYRLTTQPMDQAKVHQQEAGHYCISLLEDKAGIKAPKLLPIVYDTSKVFGEDTTMLRPIGLLSKSIRDIVKGPQYGRAVKASCFAAVESLTLQPGETATISTFYGSAEHIMDVPVYARRIMQEGFVIYKLARTREIIRQISKTISTETSHQLFDTHIQQMLLDNSLRGGIPVILGGDENDDGILNVDENPALKVFHVFSRIHGDLERDYNDFMLSPTFFSQGPVAFRDVIENRRDDVIFTPRIGSFNVRTFLSLIQADGYEPLSVESVVFTIEDPVVCDRIAERAVGRADGHRAQREALSAILKGGPLRPGQLFRLMEEQHVELMVGNQVFIDMVASAAEVTPMAVFESGFWADHWTYYLDVLKSYSAIYPDGEEKMLYDYELPYFFSPATVLPRRKKYVLDLSIDGVSHHVQQLGATVEDEDKKRHMKEFISKRTGWYKPVAHWQDDVSENAFKSTPIAKLVLLATVKFATRDAYGMGIEYEAGRPGWDYANNGLAGMLGSGVPEHFELKILIESLLKTVRRHKRPVVVPEELHGLMEVVIESLKALDSYEDNYPLPDAVPQPLFEYWDRVATAREEYREKVRITFTGETVSLSPTDLDPVLESWLVEIDKGIARAMSVGTEGYGDTGNSGIIPTYFAYKVTRYQETGEVSREGLPLVLPKSLEVSRLPIFLEGPTRMLETVDNVNARAIYQKVRKSGLRDENLSMYTLSGNLKGQPIDIGRTMAFPPGWLENQGIWLHMSYKFYLQLLRHNMYEEFFEEATSGGLLPFMDPNKYGRSLMECSSFIASSAFEDPSKHGRGYLPRLSGSTAEFLSIWIHMFIGPEPFILDPENGNLRMQLVPALPAWLFRESDDTHTANSMPGAQDADNSVGWKSAQGSVRTSTKTGTTFPTLSFTLFSAINVRYYNEKNVDLFGVPPHRYRVGLRDGRVFDVMDSSLSHDLAEMIRRVVFVDYIEAFFA